MFVLGLDIGYSNLKMVYGTAGAQPNTAIYPAGAAPQEYITQSVLSQTKKSAFQVTVNDTPYMAGVEQSSIDGWERILSEDYPFSPDYKALFYAALLATGQGVIDRVVTGLPVEQASDERKAQMRAQLEGKHEVMPGYTVTVRAAKIVPQPVGAYVNYLMSCVDPSIIEMSRVMVIDPGFFSVDWCAIDQGNFDNASADSSQEAMSVLLEEAGKLITQDYGRQYDLATLEGAVRKGSKVPAFGEMIDVGPYLDWAAGNVGETVMRKVLQKMRRSKVQGADFTLLTGGGANYYKEPASKVMEGSKVVTPSEPVIANAYGFYQLGRG